MLLRLPQVVTGLLVVAGILGRSGHAEPPVPIPDSETAVSRHFAGEVLFGAMTRDRSLRRTTDLLEVPANKRRVQLALVIDGTDSMGEEIESLRENLKAVVEGLRGSGPSPRQVEVALVVFRDDQAVSGVVTTPIPQFSSDIAMVHGALASLRPESGAPYFHERVDSGLHHALTELKWAIPEDTQTERWIVFCGDAPPYPEGAETRQHATAELGRLATEKKVRICFVLCSSGFMRPELDGTHLKEVAEAERPALSRFAAELSQISGGTKVDTASVQSVDFWKDGKAAFSPITEQDLTKARDQFNIGPSPQKMVRIAVLPHMPMTKLSFAPVDQDEVLIARQVVECLKKVVGIEPKPTDAVETEFQKILQSSDKAELGTSQGQSRLLSSLAKRLNVDYVIWGEWKRSYDNVSLESRLYRDSDGRQLARAAQETDVESAEGQRDLAGLVVRLLCRDAAYELRKTAAADPEMLTIFERVSADDKMARAIVAPLANDHRAQRSLLAGLELLERSLQSAKKQQGVSAAIDDETAVRDLKDAVSHFSQSLEFEPSNPLTHLLLANCYFNLGQTDTLDDWAVRHLESLQGAHQFAETWEDSHPIKIEIEAEFALLVNRDYRRAVELYRQLADTRSHHNGRFALRSRWMLAGIHLGDWGAISYSPDVLDVEAAREHIIAILANWPNSPEAKFYQNCLDNPTVPVGHGTLAQSR